MLRKINPMLLSLAILSIFLLFASCGNDYDYEADYWFVLDYTIIRVTLTDLQGTLPCQHPPKLCHPPLA